MKKLLAPLLVLLGLSASAQGTWGQFDRLMADGSYTSAYQHAEARFNRSRTSGDLLAAAYHMTLAAVCYQEDATDSAEARYRRLLPRLDSLERALCHAFLEQYDSALAFEALLQRTPAERIRAYCNAGKTENMTPTAFDVLCIEAQNHCRYGQQRRKVELQQRLVGFHQNDASDDLRLWHHLRLLEAMDEVPNQQDTEALERSLIEQYRGTRSPYLTRLYQRLAYRANRNEDYMAALRLCDTAIRLAPKSEGGVACANLRQEILRPWVTFDNNAPVAVPGEASLQRVRYRNVDHLWFRIVAGEVGENLYGDKERDALRKATPLHQWDIALPLGDGHRFESALLALPPLAAGNYWLLASPTADFRGQGFVAKRVMCTDMQLVFNGGNPVDGLLLDRQTGRPIVGQELLLKRGNDILERIKTDADGYFRLGHHNNLWNGQVVVERDGFTLVQWYRGCGHVGDSAFYRYAAIMADRPIYHPGDSAHLALVAYRGNGLQAEVLPSVGVKLLLIDPNGQEVAQQTLATDSYGMAHASFLLPTDRLAGSYTVRASTSDEEHFAATSLRVEEYKQPTFMVSLATDGDEAPRFGSEVAVAGMAASYSAVPIGGARVQYTVKRYEVHRYWWHHWGMAGGMTDVAEGELTTRADGTFTLRFTPQPDSNIDLGRKPTFEYVVTATVTDLNGESHEATTTLRVGYRNAVVGLAEANQTELSRWDELKIAYLDINDRPLQGAVQVRVERLRQPAVPRLDHPLVDRGTRLLVAEADWQRMFPLLAREADYNTEARWPVESLLVQATCQPTDGKATLPLRGIGSGTYRVTLVAPDADTCVEHITITLPDARQPQGQALLWADVSEEKAEVGSTVRLRFGSRFEGVEVYYALRVGNEVRQLRRFSLDNEIKHLDIEVDSTMLGGFAIDLVTAYRGLTSVWHREVGVPFSHKRLKVEVATFRDKLLPGQEEQWTLRASDPQGQPVEAALMLTLYDDALNSYGALGGWTLAPWRVNHHNAWQIKTLWAHSQSWLAYGKTYRYTGSYPSVWSLKDGLPRYSMRYARRMYKSANAVVTTSIEEVEEEEEIEIFTMADAEAGARLSADDVARMPGTSVESIVAAVGGVGYSDGSSHEPVQVRSNLGTLAFFAPDLSTAADGSVTYRFTMPDLLTRWSLRGLAYTRDLKVGTVERALITQKPLMVQPNMPRFLRSGDSLALMAKLVLAEPVEEEIPVEVSFLLTDAATCDTLCHHTERVPVRDAAQVLFDVEVPQGVYVADYLLTATADGMGDGERGQLPVVSRRQAVTVSQALYLNGAGERRFALPAWLDTGATREPLLVAAEWTDDPMWLALKAMPSLQTLENPSSLYLATQLGIDRLGREVVAQVGVEALRKAFATGGRSRLSLNDDVKQALLQSTPWVAAALGEEEQMQAASLLADTAALAARMATHRQQLADRQNADGGWGWMPEGESSLWATQQVLRAVAGCGLEGAKAALDYIDREQQRHFERHIKPHLKHGHPWEPTDIDYLFTRSFYGRAKTEAYEYYYANALKHYKDYEGLYTQAQLAVVFHRGGDRRAALDLLRRIKERSLRSDEMGLYWRDNRAGWCWHQRPVETQALLIQAFAEIAPADREAIGLMQQWLLKQKQATHWGNDRATAEAIRALMIGERSAGSGEREVEIEVFGEPMRGEAQAAEGYRQQRWSGGALDSLRARGTDEVVVARTGEGIGWGGVYYQFADDLDRLPASDMGISLRRTYQAEGPLKVGDRVKVRIDIRCDRAMDYLELVDGRPACFEPVSTRAGWRWNDGLACYITVNRSDTRCYIEHLDKGSYWFEYEVYVTNPGQFLAGAVTMQCMYAPEFRAVGAGERVECGIVNGEW